MGGEVQGGDQTSGYSNHKLKKDKRHSSVIENKGDRKGALALGWLSDALIVNQVRMHRVELCKDGFFLDILMPVLHEQLLFSVASFRKIGYLANLAKQQPLRALGKISILMQIPG
jgi:hypothetical protein